MTIHSNNKGVRKPRKSTPAVLPDSLHRKLNGYALAAGAAGVAALACAPHLEAEPVCKSSAVKIVGNNTTPFNPSQDIFPPFQIAQTTFGYYSSDYGQLFSWKRGFFTPNSHGANLLLGKSNFPADVAPEALIGPSGQFGKGASYGLLFTYGAGSPGNRHHGTLEKHAGNLNLRSAGYVGVQFLHGSQIHYGWARLQVTVRRWYVGKTTSIELLGWGYETTPNQPIAAGRCSETTEASADEGKNKTGQPASSSHSNPSLGMLALGRANQ